MKRGLFLKYVALFVGLVAVVGVINAALDLYFVYRDNRQASINVQREKAVAAAQTIESFVREIERQIGWVAYAQFDALPAEQRRFDYVRLLRQVPAITELAQLDRTGHEQLHVSRLSMDVIGSNTDRSNEPAFIEAKAHKVYYGPVYFRKGSEPYLTMAVAHGGRGGVTVADVNLKLIWDVVSQIRIGRSGYAYVIDRQGRLVAHPDISLVLRGTDMSKLAQVEEVLKQPAGDAGGNTTVDARNRNGVPVLSAHAVIDSLNWIVFVELPTAEAQQPVIDSGLRDLALLVLSLLIAGAAAALLARRMVVPIRAMQESAQRIGGGDLGHRMSIKTGDELEALADQFNRSAGALQDSYETLEQRVEDRTAELRETLEQQTASAEILRVISQSPTDVQPVLDAVADAALRFCGADNSNIWVKEGDHLVRAASAGMGARAARIPLDRHSVAGRAVLDRRTLQLANLDEVDSAEFSQSLELARSAGIHAVVATPMMREGEAIGAISLPKQAAGPFSDRQIELLESFAAQAVIAIQNVRLFTELRESLEQQTATAEILHVISQSPDDVHPVLTVVASAALRFCGARDVLIALREGDELVNVAHEGAVLAEQGRRRPIERGAISGRAAADRKTVHVPDALELDPTEFAASRRLAAERGWRAAVAAPMLREGVAIGTILLRRPDPGPFTPRQIKLLETFAAQAVIAIENVRLFTELRESLEQQTAISDVLKVLSHSTFDLEPLLQTVLETAVRLCRAQMASIFQLDDGVYRWKVGYGLDAHYRDAEISAPILPGRGTLVGRVALTGGSVRVDDALTDPEYAPIDDARLQNVHSMLGVPMTRDGKPFGVLALARDRVEAFTDKQVELVEVFADQAVIAIENVRLLSELRESLEQQTASAEILRVISESPTDVQPVLDAVARAAVRFCGAPDALIALRDGDESVVRAHHGTLPATIGFRRPITTGASGKAIREAQTIQYPDISLLDPTEHASTLERAHEYGFLSTIAAPFLIEGVAMGAIVLRKPNRGALAPRQVELLEAFAAQAVIAIENVRLFTEIQEKSRQLEVASQHKSQFLANMSHELRTPLNAILGYTEMMVDGLYGNLPDKAQATLERVQSNGKHLLGLINDVLDLSKIEAGQLALAVEDYSMADMVATVMAATESLAKTKNIALLSTLPPGLPRGTGDARRLTQVLLNLVGNAIKFTDEGKVEIRARQQDNRFKISVIDTGPGIARADQAKIFEEFQQVDNTSTRKKGGTGLGLSISRKIVELHGGYITVESEVGKGSNFKITIPINVAPIKADSPKEAAQ